MAKHRNTPYVPTQIRGVVFAGPDVLSNMGKCLYVHILLQIKFRVGTPPTSGIWVTANNLTGRMCAYPSWRNTSSNLLKPMESRKRLGKQM